MTSENQSKKSVVPSDKTLSLSSGSGSANAYCIGSYGAFQAVNVLTPSDIREVFSETNPAELNELAECVGDHVGDLVPERHEGELKDLCYKREILLHMAEQNADKKVVEQGPDGRFGNYNESPETSDGESDDTEEENLE